MSILKRSGWTKLGQGLGCLVTFLLLVLLVVLIFALIVAAIGSLFEGVGAAPGLAAAGQIALWMAYVFIAFAAIFFILLIFGTFLDSLINVFTRMIWGGPGTFAEEWQDAFNGFAGGVLQGGAWIIRKLLEAWRDMPWSVMGPVIDYLLSSRIPRPCPSSTNIEFVYAYTHTERDYPFGKSGDEIRQDAIAGAEAEATARAEAVLTAEIDRILCEEGCQKSVQSRGVRLDSPTQVAVSYGTVWDSYDATATVRASAVVVCSASPRAS